MPEQNNQTVHTPQSELPDRERLKSDAADVVEKAKQAGQQQLETGKQTAASQAEKVAAVVEQASSQFKEQNLQTLADYTSEIGSTIKSFSESLQNRSVEDLLKDVQSIARRNPTAFVLGSIAVGVAISRFFKASAERQQSTNRNTDIGYRPPKTDAMSITDF
jgi:cytosine/adenosine deaminase-related metal-dependent hydrolase